MDGAPVVVSCLALIACCLADCQLDCRHRLNLGLLADQADFGDSDLLMSHYKRLMLPCRQGHMPSTGAETGTSTKVSLTQQMFMAMREMMLAALSYLDEEV